MKALLITTGLSIIACRHMVPYYYSGESVDIPQIAEEYGFNSRFIDSSFKTLTQAGILIHSSAEQSSDNGFCLAKDPKEITLYDIVRALEGEERVECCDELIKCKPSKCEECTIYTELISAINHRREILSSTTIYKHYREMKGG